MFTIDYLYTATTTTTILHGSHMDANDEHERLETRRNASRVFFFTMTLRVRLPPPHQRTRTRTDGDGDGDTKGWGWEHERGPNDERSFVVWGRYVFFLLSNYILLTFIYM